MRFRLAHKLASFLLPGVAIATLASSGELFPPTLIILAAAMLLAWRADPGTRLGALLDRANLAITLGTIVFLAVAIFQVARSFPEVNLGPFLNFVLFLLGAKLCQRRTNRDHLQIFVLSFLVMLAAAWMATSIIFLVGFGLFVFLSTWGLILFHLRREIEENYIVRHASESRAEQVTADRVLSSRRVVGTSFFLGTGAIALLVFAGAALVFVAIPRVGLGFILGGVRRQGATAGFSDEVKLGRKGTISLDNQTVVIRAKIPAIIAIPQPADREAHIEGLYWRGTVYDSYSLGQWIRSRDDQNRTLVRATPSPQNFGRTYLITDPFEVNPHITRRAALRGTLEQEIELMPMSYPAAFALDRPVAIELPPPAAGSFITMDTEARYGGEVIFRQFRINPANPFDRRDPLPEFLGARYVAYSRTAMDPAHAPIHAEEEQLGVARLERYLLIPSELPQRVRDLAHQITAGHASPAAKIQAVIAWLHATHGYTTTLARDERFADPLEDFLFEQKAGHCEYFASAAAVLLRLAGVPTRYVNGFLGGEWNDLQQLVTVRENRAHSWVEAYAGREGWVRVDATPPQPRSARMGTTRQLLDAAELFFSRWILEYNASQQLRLAQRLGKPFGLTKHRRGFDRPSLPLSRRQAALLTLGIIGLFLLLKYRHALLRLARGRALPTRIVSRDEKAVTRLYAHTVKRLAAAGHPRQASETPHEYLRRMAHQGIEGLPVFTDLTECYVQARYGNKDIPGERLEALQARIQTVRPAA